MAAFLLSLTMWILWGEKLWNTLCNHPFQPPVSADNFRNKLFLSSIRYESFHSGGKWHRKSKVFFKTTCTYIRFVKSNLCPKWDRQAANRARNWFLQSASTPRISAFSLCSYTPVNETWPFCCYKNNPFHPKEPEALPTGQHGGGKLINYPNNSRPTSRPTYLCPQTIIMAFSKNIWPGGQTTWLGLGLANCQPCDKVQAWRGGICPSGHLAVSGDIFGHHNWGRGMLPACSGQRPGCG